MFLANLANIIQPPALLAMTLPTIFKFPLRSVFHLALIPNMFLKTQLTLSIKSSVNLVLWQIVKLALMMSAKDASIRIITTQLLVFLVIQL